jgi:excisionase family DNA binding protein
MSTSSFLETVKLTMGEPHADDLMTTGEAARVLGVSADMVRWLEREGRLPAQRTTNGVRLFRRGDVEKLAAERARAAGATSNEGARAPRDRARRGK